MPLPSPNPHISHRTHNSLRLLSTGSHARSLFAFTSVVVAQNLRARSTGQLSAFAVSAQITGCAARLFTTIEESGDAPPTAGFIFALVPNVILGMQMVILWGQGIAESRKEETWAGDEKSYLP